jgi:amino acid transporter/nucleotide-binding universal stress UspA family protein
VSLSDSLRPSAAPKVVVATTIALSFISFWRGASIVLSDLASSAFYAGGAAEQAVGMSAPWFVLAVMLFSFAVRSAHVESCSMYVRGGVYIVVRDSMGPVWAKLSVSALVFDYILTGPISGVSAGQYLGALINELSELMHTTYRVNVNLFSVGLAVLATVYFWWINIKGVHESSGKALRIVQVMTVMVVILLIWCPITIFLKDRWGDLPPAPVPSNLTIAPEAQGWLAGTFWLQIPVVAIVVAFGHSLLSMSGFETLAQIYREIASPKMKNLKIAANIVCVYALVCTGVVTLFASMIIPDAERPSYYTNLIGGLAMNLSGPYALRLLFHIFVVFVGGLILSGALNTSIIGANGILSRVAEDGVMLPWFRQPHKKFGTTHRMINLTVILQLATILYSRGNMTVLAQAYAFGVVWSFFFKSLGVTVLRFQRHDQEYKTPLNFQFGGREIPVGLILVTLVLGAVAVANLFTKQLATQYGIAFTLALFLTFTLSERINLRRVQTERKGLEQFTLDPQAEIDASHLQSRPGCVLVAARDYHRLEHLRQVLTKTNLRRHDIVVMTVRPISTGAGEYELTENQIFSDHEKELFSHVVELAEKEGKHVDLLAVPGVDPFEAIVQTANSLQASRVVTGVSSRMESAELARRIGLAWERLPGHRHPFSLEIISPDRDPVFVNLGPHPPRLWPEDLALLHEIWLKLSNSDRIGSKLHHRDVVGVALQRLKRDLDGKESATVIDEFKPESPKEPR